MVGLFLQELFRRMWDSNEVEHARRADHVERVPQNLEEPNALESS